MQTAETTISLFEASILGVVEGLTEFLPVSSTGHLILSSRVLNLDLTDPGVTAFLIVIQAGALLAVVGMYAASVRNMALGLAGRSPEGLRLFGLLMLAFLPAAIVGPLFEDRIDALFADERQRPVAWALAVGGVLMIAFEAWRARRVLKEGEPAEDRLAYLPLTWRMALFVGIAQCLALIPGTSRSMVTIVAAMIAGLPPRAAAEFSFLLALPTLGGATVYKLMKDGSHIMESTGAAGLSVGFVVSCIVAFAAMRYFLRYLTRHGLALFGWYRLALAGVVFSVW